jgi:mannose-6-phosphate isomerase-like protein (cupin superfamily)
MQTFDLGALIAEQTASGRAWREFLRADALSVGIYQLKAGQEDGQSPHAEDEVYYIVAGRARFRAGNTVVAVQPGTVLYVSRQEVHRFFDITEDLTALVFFAPPEESLAGGS